MESQCITSLTVNCVKSIVHLPDLGTSIYCSGFDFTAT